MPKKLTAEQLSATHELPLTMVTASSSERTITGSMVEYGAVGFASLGPTIFEPGSITVPEPINKAKLLLQHDAERPVGILSTVSKSGTTDTAVFTLPAGQAGDDALAMAESGLRDGLSVGVHIDDYEFDQDGILHVKAGRLVEVSLVTIPAFENARVTDVAANRKENPMPTELQTPVTEQPKTEAAATEPAVVAAAAAPMPITHAAAPLPTVKANLVSTTLGALKGGAAAVQAALTDLVPADDPGKVYIKDQTVGELFENRKVARPLFEAGGVGPLTSLTVAGKRKQRTVTVGKWAGGKAEIPSSKFSTSEETSKAQGFAGAVDIAMELIEFADESVIEEWYTEAVDDYIRKTEAEALAKLTAGASKVAGATSLIGALDKAVATLQPIGGTPNLIAVSSDVYSALISAKDADVPWWFKQQASLSIGDRTADASNITFAVNPDLPAKSVLVADRAAYKTRESAEFRYQAQNIAQGGVDISLIRFVNVWVTDPASILLFTTVSGIVETPAVAG